MPERPSNFLNIRGRRVDFTDGLPLAWGIEVDVPFDLEEKNRLKEKFGIQIPPRVTTFKYVDLNPQESLPPHLRNIGMHEDWARTNLDDLVALGRTSPRIDLRRRRTIEEIFFYVFGRNDKQIRKFNSLIQNGGGNTFVAVRGHSWSAPWEIGEYNPDEPSKPKLLKYQVQGNAVPVRTILKKYNQPDLYSGILIYACYNGEKRVAPVDVPFVYAVGIVGGEWSQLGLLPVVVVKPRPSI